MLCNRMTDKKFCNNESTTQANETFIKISMCLAVFEIRGNAEYYKRICWKKKKPSKYSTFFSRRPIISAKETAFYHNVRNTTMKIKSG